MSAQGQQGFTLLLALLVLVAGVATLIVSARTPGYRSDLANSAEDFETLTRARELIVARAATDQNRPGSVSCPDLDNTGSASTNDCDEFLGRFPYRTYGTPQLHDTDGNPLWYAVDPRLVDRFGTGIVVNPDSVINDDGTRGFRINGMPGYGAAVIAPGPPLADQLSRTASPIDPAQYLDDGSIDSGPFNNATGPPFHDCTHVHGCNDRVHGISVDELFRLVQARLLDALEGPLEGFFADHGYLPYAAPFGETACEVGRTRGQLALKASTTDDEGTGACGGTSETLNEGAFEAWVRENEWLNFVVYHVASECTAAQKRCGTGNLQIDDQSGLNVVVAAAGRAFGFQDRIAEPSVSAYLESGLEDGEPYRNRPWSQNNNDLFRGR